MKILIKNVTIKILNDIFSIFQLISQQHIESVSFYIIVCIIKPVLLGQI